MLEQYTDDENNNVYFLSPFFTVSITWDRGNLLPADKAPGNLFLIREMGPVPKEAPMQSTISKMVVGL